MSATPPDSAPHKKGHTRNAPSADERRVSIPRRRTKGPLDFEENPPPVLATLTSPVAPPTPATAFAAIPPPAKDATTTLRHPPLFHPLPPPLLPTTMAAAATPSTPLPTLLTTGQFRAAAISAAATLCDPAVPLSAPQVYALWHVRLSALTLLGLAPTAAQEAKALTGLDLPWDLRVLAVRLQAVAWGDWRRCIAAYYDLGREARSAALAASTSTEQAETWRARLAALGVRVASALVEMGDLSAAARHLASLQPADDGGGGAGLAEARCLLWLRVGNVAAARAALPEAPAPGMAMAALLEMADGRYDAAAAAWRGADDAPAELRAVNLAVALLYTGRLEEARAILEDAVERGPVFAGLVFNLATVYELCSDGARTLKRALAERVGGRAEVGAGAFKM